jgi:hypothetical protein
MRLIPEADVTSGTELFSAFQTFAGANERPSKVKERMNAVVDGSGRHPAFFPRRSARTNERLPPLSALRLAGYNATKCRLQG